MKNFSPKNILLAGAALALCSCAAVRENPPDGGNAAASAETADAPTPDDYSSSAADADDASSFEALLAAALAEGDSDLAAYVAEYVLSAEELTDFVEKNCPAAKNASPNAAQDAIDTPGECAREVRYTLARRLLREGQWAKARGYFPEELLPTFNAYVAAIQRGYDLNLSEVERARGFWDAALIVRSDGDALFLAAAGPTYVSGGEWEENPILRHRFSENIATAEERSRVESRDVSRFVNDRRFRAAMLAQNAASLLPNNDERTARLLCSAGVWLRYRDPKTADGFYKSIVIRCPQTETGKRCRELNWFPPERSWTDAQAWDGPAAGGAAEAAAPQEEPPPAADEAR